MRQKIIPVILGLCVSLILLEIILRLSGFIFLSLQEYRSISSARQKGVYRIMCLGESTTAIGGGDSYPSQLEEILNQRNIGIKFKVINKGKPVVDTSYMLAHLEENLNQCQPDMVTAMIGANDTYIKYYEDIPDARSILFNKSSAYRFFRLLYMNTLSKIRKTGVYKPQREAKSRPLHSDISAAGLEWCAKALKGIPDSNFISARAYLALGGYYRSRGRLALARQSFLKAIELNPKNDNAYVRLAEVYRDQERYPEAEEAYKKAIELSPQKDNAYIQLGRFYRDCFKKPGEAEQALKKAVELNPQNAKAYLELGRYFLYYAKFGQAEEMFKKAIQIDPGDAEGYRGLVALYSGMGEDKSADIYYRKANQLSPGYYSLVTSRNYQKLKEILDKRGVKLVCVQYPMRSIKPLKAILKDQRGVIFVDNEEIFRAALKKGELKDYFTDMFGGEFGHCTRKGNRLIAENIADTILKEYFKR